MRPTYEQINAALSRTFIQPARPNVFWKIDAADFPNQFVTLLQVTTQNGSIPVNVEPSPAQPPRTIKRTVAFNTFVKQYRISPL